MNFILLKATIKANYKLLLIMLAIMVMYSTIIVSMYNPDSMESWQAMLEMFPEEVLRAMNFNILDPTFLGYIAGYYYGFIMIMFPMVYVSIMGQRLIARLVDDGSMSFLLATPNSREKIASTQGFYLLLSTTFLITAVACLLAIVGGFLFPGSLTLLPFIVLNINVIALFALLSGISYLASCVFNEVKHATLWGAGIPALFFIINMLANVNDKLSFLRYFTVFSLFDTEKILEKNPVVLFNIVVLLLSGLLCYGLGIIIFKRKDLHI
jgi:ABC-2 type transport system permease protein